MNFKWETRNNVLNEVSAFFNFTCLQKNMRCRQRINIQIQSKKAKPTN